MAKTLSPKERITILLLAAQAVACIIFALSPIAPGGVLIFIMAFPFAQVGQGLRALSLLGSVGNAIAMVLYTLFCAAPIFIIILIREKKPEDMLLLALSIVLFIAMYHMVNPGRIPSIAGPARQAVLGGIIHSMVLAYFILRILRLFTSTHLQGLNMYMRIMLHVLNVLFVFAIFGLGFGQMQAAFAALRAGNIGHEHLLGTTYVFIALRHITNALPHLLSIWVIFYAHRLLEALGKDQYSGETLYAAGKVTWVCRWALGMTVLSFAGFNLLQFIFISRLRVVDSNLHFPVTSVLFVLGTLLLTRYIGAGKQLKDENDQFI